MQRAIIVRFISLIFSTFLLLTACGTTNNTANNDGSPDNGLVTTYTIVFRNLTTKEVFSITDEMEKSYGFVRWRDYEGGSGVSKHGYVTRASGSEVHKNMYDILSQMGLSLDGQVKMIKRGTTFNLDKIF